MNRTENEKHFTQSTPNDVPRLRFSVFVTLQHQTESSRFVVLAQKMPLRCKWCHRSINAHAVWIKWKFLFIEWTGRWLLIESSSWKGLVYHRIHVIFATSETENDSESKWERLKTNSIDVWASAAGPTLSVSAPVRSGERYAFCWFLFSIVPIAFG